MMRRTVFTAALLGVVAAGPAGAADIRFATVGVGSSWYNYGAGFAEMALPNLPAGSSIDVLPIAGGVGNIKLLQQGEAEFGISFPMPAAEACTGTGEFSEVQDKVRGVLGGLDVYYFAAFMTTKSGVKSWDEIVAGKVDLVTAGVGGTGEVGVRQALESMGSTKDKVEAAGGSVKAMKRDATAAAISDGQADGWAHIVTKGHPIATQLTTTTDMIVLPLPEAVREKMVKSFGWVMAEMPAGLFKGQTVAVPTVKAASNIMTRADVPDDVVYAFVKTIMEGAAKLPAIHAALGDFDPKDAAAAGLVGNCPLHPGAVKYFREVGML